MQVLDILTISSHVVHGHVGNDALQFPLNLRNWNVDAIHTTNLSTHPGRSTPPTRVAVQADEITRLYAGVSQFKYDALLVGYIGRLSSLTALDDILGKFKGFLVIDPVMGDNGRVYVEEGVVGKYIDLLRDGSLNNVDLCTPNQFEMELLTDIKITSLVDLNKAVSVFHDRYPCVRNVVVTSVILDGIMFCAGISFDKSGDLFCCKVSEIDAVFSGSGDLFVGILTDELYRSGELKSSLINTISVVEKVLERTNALTETTTFINNKKYIRDLKIVSCKDLLISSTK